ncbi:hypothetical protein [Frigoribacterium sp. CG_9.8]|uniref:hypothetical protein n=1 Tax=Frigoribacterium sp. CG_9.8 TaxID=2787733 RepID=UPI0018CAE10A|nr:hypothetical protein [Frigoribacterium sp. CG_9.8]MBG6106634.1 hypothetical protein [Frigoribacterium sp. CG_9.8]
MSDVLTDNGLPVAAQPWARRIDKFLRDDETRRQILANNSETAIVMAGNAITASANSVQAQIAAQYEMQRIPATLAATALTVAPSTYFDTSGAPYGRLNVSIVPSDLDVDGNPLIPTIYQVWGRVFYADGSIANGDTTTIGYGPGYLMLGTSPSTNVQVDALQVGVQYQIRVVAISAWGVSSVLSDYVLATTPATLTVMATPNSPSLSSGAGMLVAAWNGLFGSALPSSQFRYTYAEVSVSGAAAWIRMGSALVRGGGSIQIAGLIVGASYDVRLIAIDSLGAATLPSPSSTTTIVGVSAGDLTPALLTVVSTTGNNLTWADTTPTVNGVVEGDLWFRHNTANNIIAQWQWIGGAWLVQTISHETISSIDLGSATVGTLNGGLITAGTIGATSIVAGSLTVNELSPTVGRDLNLSANGTVTILAGQVAEVANGLSSTSSNLAAMQTFYSFGPTGAIISNPGSPFQLALKPDRIEMIESGAVVSYWNSGQLFVNSFVGTEVVLGNHKLEKLGSGTVVRSL